MSVFHRLRQYAFGNQRVIPSLDGLRAVSIGCVLLAHLTGTAGFPLSSTAIYPMGEFGVRVFFVISGYLITSILLQERQRHGRIALGRFYARRTLRLMPAAYAFIGVVALLAGWGLLRLERGDLLFAATYTMNFWEARGWSLGHLWSLAVEEQFYLLWPLALLLLGPPRVARLLVAILLLAPLARMTSPLVGPAFNFVIWADTLATGCLLALWRERLHARPAYRRLLGSRAFAVVPLLALAANFIPSTKVSWLVGATVMNVAIALCADWAMTHPGGAVGRVLNWPPVAFAGVLSYSLYLWQQLFLNRYSSSPLCAFPQNLLLTFAAALASYLLVEAQFLRLRARLERPRAAGDLEAPPQPLPAPALATPPASL
jgi:peptidoglycan/LPS O-acetylase OafA/YrhL